MMINENLPIVTVIVPVYMQWDILEKLLYSLDKQEVPQNYFECIIVNNDGSDNHVDTNLHPYVREITCKKPGAYAARNLGLSLAKGKIISFTDADCQPAYDWLNKIIEAFYLHGEKVIFAGSVEVKKTDYGSPSISEIYDTVVGIPQSKYVKSGVSVTANLSVPNKIFDKIGSFNETSFSGGDFEFCKRAKKADIPLMYIEDALVIHPARSKASSIIKKARRIKGGKITGNGFEKTFALMLNFLPPVRSTIEIIKTSKINFPQKIKVFFFHAFIWLIGIIESIRVISGGRKERR